MSGEKIKKENKTSEVYKKIIALLVLIIIFFGYPTVEVYMYDHERTYFERVINFVSEFNNFIVWFLFIMLELLAVCFRKFYPKKENLIADLIAGFVLLLLLLLFSELPPALLILFLVVIISWSIRQFIAGRKARKVWLILLIIFLLFSTLESSYLKKTYYYNFGKIVKIRVFTFPYVAEKECKSYTPNECKFIEVKCDSNDYNYYICTYGCPKSFSEDSIPTSEWGVKLLK